MSEPSQTVIYRLDKAHKPIWQFHSLPESIVGGGRSLEHARTQYRDALLFSVDGGPLPNIREFIERQTEGPRIWVRTSLASPVADNAYRQIARQVAAYPDRDLDWFHRYPSAGGEPVVVPCGPTDTLGSIFDQMTPFDSLIAVMGYGPGDRVVSVAWLAIQGAATVRKGDTPISLDEFRLTRDSQMAEVFRLGVEQGDVTVSSLFGDTHSTPPARLAILAPA